MIRVSKAGLVIEVVAPYYEPFVERARGMMGRCQNGVWRFSPLREAEVRAALWELFGTDGTPVPTVAVEVTLSPAEADEASVWALGRRLVRRALYGYPVALGEGVVRARGRGQVGAWFPTTSGTKGRPTLGHAAPVVLEVRQVPEELARRMAEKEPGRYRVVASGEARR